MKKLISFKINQAILFSIPFFLFSLLLTLNTSAKDIPRKGISTAPSTIEYHGDLYVFMKGNDNEYDRGRLEYKIRRDGKWSKQLVVPGVKMSNSPGAIVYNGMIYIFYQDYEEKGHLQFTVFDGKEWTGGIMLKEDVMFESPVPIIYNDKLYVFHNAKQWRSGRLYNNELGYVTFDRKNWEYDMRAPDMKLHGSPAPVIYDGKIYVYHRSNNGKGQLYYNVFDGNRWQKDIQIEKYKIKRSPAAIVPPGEDRMVIFVDADSNDPPYQVNAFAFDGKTISDFRGPSSAFTHQDVSLLIQSDKELYLYYNKVDANMVQYVTYEDGRWTQPTSLPLDAPQVEMGKDQFEFEPSVVEYQGKLYAFMHAANSDRLLEYRVWEDGNWSHKQFVPGSKLSDGPGAVVYKDKLFVFHQDHLNKGDFYYRTFDGQNWSASSKLDGRYLSYSPKAVVYKDKLYIFHHGKGKNGQLWYFTYDGNNFSQDIRVDNTGITDSPAPVVFDNKLFVYHQGKGNNQELWVNSYDGSSWKGDFKLEGRKMYGAPNSSLSPDKSKMYIYARSTNKNTKGMMNVYGYNGYGQSVVENKSFSAVTEEAASSVYFNDKLYMFYNDMNDHRLKYIIQEDGKWTQPTDAPKAFSLASYNLLDKKFGTFTIPATVHSAIITNKLNRVNQSIDPIAQMNYGVRYIEIDYNKWIGSHPLGREQSGTDISYNVLSKYHKGYIDWGNGKYPIDEVLPRITEWLNNNPNELLIIKFAAMSDVNITYLRNRLSQYKLNDKFFVPEDGDFTKLTPRDILNQGKQIIAYGKDFGLDLGEYESGFDKQLNPSVTTEIIDMNQFYPRAKENNTEKYPIYNLYLSGYDTKNVDDREDPRGYFTFGSLDKAKYLNYYGASMDRIIEAWKKSAMRPFSIQFGFVSYGQTMDMVRSLNHDYNSIRGKAIDQEGNIISGMTYQYRYPDFDDKTSVNGKFDFPVKRGETVEIIPVKDGITFSPSSYTYNNDSGEDAEITFTIASDTANRKSAQLEDQDLFAQGIGPIPFFDHVEINIQNPEDGMISVQWYTMQGALIETAHLGHHPKGQHTIKYKPNLPRGAFIYKAVAGDNMVTGTSVRE